MYSGRNLGSPGFGGPGGIFTYPASGANSHHTVSDCLIFFFETRVFFVVGHFVFNRMLFCLFVFQ